MKQTVVIFGKGYIGLELGTALTAEGYQVMQLSRAEMDYTNPSSLSSFLTQLKEKDKKTIIINCVGFTGKPNVDECEISTVKPVCLSLNASLPLAMASECKSLNLPFIHVSSGCIYNGYTKVFSETDTPNFGVFNPESSFYSKTKHQGEINLSSINYGSILRIRMPFTRTPHPRNFLVKINKYPDILNSENSVTSVEDFCAFVYQFIKIGAHKSYGIYNVVNPGVVTNRSIRTMMGTADKCRVVTEDYLLQNGMMARRSNCLLSTTLIESLGLGLPSASYSLSLAISEIHD